MRFLSRSKVGSAPTETLTSSRRPGEGAMDVAPPLTRKEADGYWGFTLRGVRRQDEKAAQAGAALPGIPEGSDETDFPPPFRGTPNPAPRIPAYRMRRSGCPLLSRMTRCREDADVAARDLAACRGYASEMGATGVGVMANGAGCPATLT